MCPSSIKDTRFALQNAEAFEDSDLTRRRDCLRDSAADSVCFANTAAGGAEYFATAQVRKQWLLPSLCVCAFVRLCDCAFVRLCVCEFVRLCACALVRL